MNLVFIYGPPAVGKLTVAEELAKLTGYKLFHNHLTQDLAGEIFPDFGLPRFDLVYDLRLDVFRHAAKGNINLIFTCARDNDERDKQFIKDTIDAIFGNNGKICFVQLTAPREVLMERVIDDSRKRFHKISDKNKLSDSLDTHDLEARVDFDEVLVVDTSKQSAAASARQIAEYFKIHYYSKRL